MYHMPHQSQRPQRPRLQSFQPYETLSLPTPSTPSGPGGLAASCRALQSMLEGPGKQPHSPGSQSAYYPNSPLSRSKLQPPLLTPPCSSQKRGREEYEEDCSMSDSQQDQIFGGERETRQMPKRQRSTALNCPLQFQMAGFNALPSPHTPQLSQIRDVEMRLTPSQDVLQLDPSLQQFSHSQMLPTQSMNHQNYWPSEHDRQFNDSAFATLDLPTQDQFVRIDYSDQQMMHLDQQWMHFGGEGNMGLSVW